MKEEKPTGSRDPFLLLAILIRVLLILIVWLGVFLATFLGYFTVPVILIGIVAISYMLSDIGLYVAFRRRDTRSMQRRRLLDSFKNRPTKEK